MCDRVRGRDSDDGALRAVAALRLARRAHPHEHLHDVTGCLSIICPAFGLTGRTMHLLASVVAGSVGSLIRE